jgi:hypothetical protein
VNENNKSKIHHKVTKDTKTATKKKGLKNQQIIIFKIGDDRTFRPIPRRPVGLAAFVRTRTSPRRPPRPGADPAGRSRFGTTGPGPRHRTAR